MQRIDEIVIDYQGARRTIELFIGDLSAIPAQEAVDLLLVSAFPNDYTPTRTSLIGALDRRGVSVAKLARDKAVDLRNLTGCWLSKEIAQAGQGFRWIACFEPLRRGNPPEVVGDIFRSIIAFTTDGPPIRQVAMPLVAAGDQHNPKEVMLEAILDAAVNWVSIGLPVDRIKIVFADPADAPSLKDIFARAKSKLPGPAVPVANPWRFDLFISYSHEDKGEVDLLVKTIRERRPTSRIFLDRMELKLGAAWQQHLFEAIEASRKVVTVFSPPYLGSKVCLEEYNIGHFRHRDSQEGVLRPVYLRSASLPTYMKLIQFVDAREGDPAKLSKAAEEIASDL